MTELPIYVFEADTPEGRKHYVSCLSHEVVFKHGLPPEAIIGALHPWKPGEPISPSVFAKNSEFVDFMHSVIARRGPALSGLIEEAKRQGEGWVFVVDQRTPTPGGAVPPEDLVGVFEIKNGEVVPGAYRASPNHLILSEKGFFRLGSELQPCLLEELAERVGSAN